MANFYEEGEHDDTFEDASHPIQVEDANEDEVPQFIASSNTSRSSTGTSKITSSR